MKEIITLDPTPCTPKLSNKCQNENGLRKVLTETFHLLPHMTIFGEEKLHLLLHVWGESFWKWKTEPNNDDAEGSWEGNVPKISYYGFSNLASIEGSLNADNYKNIITNYLEPAINRLTVPYGD